MRWLDYAEGELGQHELRGSQHNPRILEYHSTTTLGDWGRSRDETPWCSSFINWCFVRAGVQGTDNALARSWIRWGSPVALRDWQLGDVMVVRHRRGKARSVGSRGGYHVVYPYRVGKRFIVGLGGNQGNEVSFKRFSRRRWDVIAVRRCVALTPE